MSDCMGSITVATNVDGEMRELIDEEADKRAITPSEFLRRVLDVYKASEEGKLSCPSCGATADLTEAV